MADRNVLHDYATYTYRLSLHAISPSKYNDLVDSPDGYKPTNVLISSGGARGSSFPRDPNFHEDFYFDKLSIETVTGMSATTRNTNAITLNFTIIEPYGLTLLNRIIDVASSLGAENFKTMPFILQIDFFGAKDDGIPTQITDITKRIPIRFLELKMKVTNKGGVYEISATPYGHTAFEETVVTTPVKLEVMAKTIGEFFNAHAHDPGNLAQVGEIVSKRVSLQNAVTSAQRSQRSTLNDSAASARVEKSKKDLAAFAGVTPAPVQITSYAEAVNKWNDTLQLEGLIEVADVISFEVDKSFKDSTFPKAAEIAKDAIEMKQTTDKQTGVATARHTAEGDEVLIPINQGTSVTEVIGIAMRNSKYIRDQVSEEPTNKTGFIDWFKIIPKVKLRAYDKIRKTFAKEYIYVIKKFRASNTENRFAAKTIPSKSVKDYNYIFTGKNDDVLDLDMTFDTTYFTIDSAKNKNLDNVNGTPNANNVGTDEKSKSANYKDSKPGQSKENDALKPQLHYSANSAATVSNELNSMERKVGELQAQMLSSSAGDMLSVELKIIGDPAFIKQDDILYSLASGETTPDGGIVTDNEEIYCNLTFLTPTDYDDSTGLEDPKQSKYTSSVFSGYYRVLIVTSEFHHGQFTQTLHLVRSSIQPEK